ncbi:CLUMA_CG005274, isoform A [Clunio marinus]|uniref:CLUMA_CG005274, isoform A n=1 Tax=Clunio marinus TaxID=568069 RepID=A0A1J1HW87_9DIPT|nr:CLUMA_CG005274, isoform A [Clunio marinus]
MFANYVINLSERLEENLSNFLCKFYESFYFVKFRRDKKLDFSWKISVFLHLFCLLVLNAQCVTNSADFSKHPSVMVNVGNKNKNKRKTKQIKINVTEESFAAFLFTMIRLDNSECPWSSGCVKICNISLMNNETTRYETENSQLESLK